MPTSDERREVAARLRDFRLASDYAYSDGSPFTQGEVVKALRAIVGNEADGRPDIYSLAGTLANLIDPTCEDVSEPPDSGGFWPSPHFKCSVCGTQHVSVGYVRYCPNCGARVVSVDE